MEPDAKRQKLADEVQLSRYEDEPVKLLAPNYAKNLRTFFVHKKILCEVSEFFEEEFAKGVSTLQVAYPADVVECFVTWIFEGRTQFKGFYLDTLGNIACSGLAAAESQENGAQDAITQLLPGMILPTLKLYVFAKVHGIPRLAHQAILDHQRLSYRTNKICKSYLFMICYRKFGLEDDLCQWWMRVTAWRAKFEDPKPLEGLNAVVFTNLLRLVSKRRNGDETDPAHDWCQFHGHSSEDEKKECEQKRSNDPDVVYKQQQVSRDLQKAIPNRAL